MPTKHTRCPATLAEFRSSAAREAYRAFFFTSGFASFWGANSHNEGLIRAVHKIVPKLDKLSVVDAGGTPLREQTLGTRDDNLRPCAVRVDPVTLLIRSTLRG